MIAITLYTKDNCGLCEEVKTHLASLQASYPHQLSEIDITTDTAVYEQYKFIIPVVEIGDSQLQAPIHYQHLVAALEAADT